MTMYYETAGSGSPVVFIHGFGSDARIWDAQFVALSQRYRVIRYDLRGFGRSDIPTGAYAHTDDLKALLDQLGIPRAHIVGQSAGGAIALDFALECPDRIDRVVLVDSTIDGYEWSPESTESWTPVFAKAAEVGLAGAMDVLLAHPLFAVACEQPDVRERLAEILGGYSGWHAVNDDPVRTPIPPAIQRLEQITAPTLVILGERDEPDYHNQAHLLAERLPHATLLTLPGIGHVVPLEAAAQLSQILSEFLPTVTQ